MKKSYSVLHFLQLTFLFSFLGLFRLPFNRGLELRLSKGWSCGNLASIPRLSVPRLFLVLHLLISLALGCCLLSCNFHYSSLGERLRRAWSANSIMLYEHSRMRCNSFRFLCSASPSPCKVLSEATFRFLNLRGTLAGGQTVFLPPTGMSKATAVCAFRGRVAPVEQSG